MLDVHVLLFKSNPSWLDQCVTSISQAVSRAPFEVTVHFIEGVIGHIGVGRKDGFSRGNHPYVSFVDDDDWLERDAFSCLEEALLDKPGAIFTREYVHQNGHRFETSRRHHLAVYERSITDGAHLENFPCYDAMALRHHAERSGRPIIDLPSIVYNYRLHGKSAARQLQRKYPDLLRLARAKPDC